MLYETIAAIDSSLFSLINKLFITPSFNGSITKTQANINLRLGQGDFIFKFLNSQWF